MKVLCHRVRWLMPATFLFTVAPFHLMAQSYSPAQNGMLGLNAIPNARMDEVGTLRFGGSFSDPYVNGFMGLQVSKRLGLVLRQTAEISDVTDDPSRFYPGLDIKFMLLEEDKYRPQIALGLQSAFGHKRTSGEYLAISKRYYDWDFTAGLGWGRYGSSFSFDNPLKGLSGSHFGEDRSLDGELPNRPRDWFTGDQVGLFAGIEYQAPLIDGLSFKLDIGADRYEAERSAFDFNPAAPWSAGVNYQADLGRHTKMDSQLSIQGTERLMARLSFSRLVDTIGRQPSPAISKPFAHNRPADSSASLSAARLDALRDKLILSPPRQGSQAGVVNTQLTYNPRYTMPAQVGHAAQHLANNVPKEIEKISVRTGFLGLRGPTVSLMRSDLESALAYQQGSADEIWQNTEISIDHPQGWWPVDMRKRTCSDDVKLGFTPFKLILDHHFSLGEEDHGVLHRTSAVAKLMLPRKTGYLDYGAALRFNLRDNLHHVEELRPRAILPVRSDEINFAKSFVGLEEAYLSFTHSLRPDLHIAATTGYLEEMYAGSHAEILYRPYKSRYAFSADAALALKRDPDSRLNLLLTGDRVLTGQLNGYYDWPYEDITLKASAGRFLNEDLGARIGFIKPFKNGAQLSGYVSLSNTSDADLFGGTTHSDHGLRLTIPLGGVKQAPDFVEARITSKPFGRDIAQSLDEPVDLYDLTTAFTLPHIARHWGDIITNN